MALIAKAKVIISGFEVGTAQFAPHEFVESFCFLKAGGKKEDETDPASVVKAKEYIDETIQMGNSKTTQSKKEFKSIERIEYVSDTKGDK